MAVRDPPFFVYEVLTGSVFDVPPLRANKRSKKDSGVIVDIPSHEGSWLQEVQFASVASCTVEWFTYGSALDSGRGPEVVVVDLRVLDELQLCSNRNDGWTKDVGAAKHELQKR